MEQTGKCSHKYCHCPAQAASGFCSDYCAKAAEELEKASMCKCGHLDCSGVMIADMVPAMA